jgi:anti-anti-sigma regulatory factor
VHEAIPAAPGPVGWLVFDAEAVTHCDSSGLEALAALTRTLTGGGIVLVMARLRTRMESQFALAGVTELIGADRFYPTVQAAVAACFEASPG